MASRDGNQINPYIFMFIAPLIFYFFLCTFTQIYANYKTRKSIVFEKGPLASLLIRMKLFVLIYILFWIGICVIEK